MAITANGLTGENLASNADVKSTQTRHRFDPVKVWPGRADSIDEVVHRIRGAEPILLQVAAWMEDVPTGADEVEVDVQYSIGGSAFTSLLTAPIVFDSGSSDRVVQAAVIATSALVAGGLVKAVVTVTGTTGANLGMQIVIDEKAS